VAIPFLEFNFKQETRPYMIRSTFFVILSSLLFFSCQKKRELPDPGPDPVTTPTTSTAVFAKGADASWVTEMETAGKKFYNASGAETECYSLLKSLGMNTVRLRVWVNPANSYNGKSDVLAKALRAKNLGLRIMIDFHYSDTWADPGHQAKPAAWASLDVAGLKAAITTHTTDVLTTLKTNGIVPEWVQVGNETSDGMLWPEGRASTNMVNYAQFFKAGYDAVKAVDPNIRVIAHLSDGFNNSLFQWNLDGLKNNGAKWDVTGMSLYPDITNWATKNTQCLANMNDMVSRYGKEVMVVEVGMPWDSPVICRNFIEDLMAKIKSVPGNNGTGLLYWEPESYGGWQGYTLGAFDNSGKPTEALNPFH
jgi:arabinogalactan endo-1,4-beta-galactosidase